MAGLVVSGYLTYEHYTNSTTLACPDTGRVNCAKVTSSQYSTLAGVPVALLGTLYFAVLLPLLTPLAWRSPRRWVRATRAAMAGLGVAMVLYLVWTEFYRVGAICLWCTAVHAITFLIFVVVVFVEALRGGRPPVDPLDHGLQISRRSIDAYRGRNCTEPPVGASRFLVELPCRPLVTN